MTEYGFYNAATGYWQTVGDKPDLSAYPAGTVEVPIKPGAGWTWNGSQWIAPPALTKDDLAAYTRDKSRQVRVGGTTINGSPVKTDDGSLALINGMAALAQQDSTRTFSFDTGDGTTVLTLTAAEAIAFAQAVGGWVQLTFDRRAEVLTAIGAGTVTTPDQIDAAFADVTAAWSPPS